MKISFRWHGTEDKVTLEQIRQIPGMEAIVTAVYDAPVGAVWSNRSIFRLRKQVEDAGLAFDVIESIPVHEDIKLGKATRDRYIENYCENIRRVAAAGIKCICYNFTPVLDWIRTQTDPVPTDASASIACCQSQADQASPPEMLPGWESGCTGEELKLLVAEYQSIKKKDLWDNLKYFLEHVIPVAAACEVNMAIYQGSSCRSSLGLPRIIDSQADLDRFLKLVDDPHNGLTFCDDLLEGASENDMVKMAAQYAAMGRIHFACLCSEKVRENGFEEPAGISGFGSSDMPAIVKVLQDNGFHGYVNFTVAGKGT